jgi:hypothetical protein
VHQVLLPPSEFRLESLSFLRAAEIDWMTGARVCGVAVIGLFMEFLVRFGVAGLVPGYRPVATFLGELISRRSARKYFRADWIRILHT